MASDNFIVHIYRRDESHPEQLVGLVEDIDLGCTQAFQSMEILWRILIGVNSKAKKPATQACQKAITMESKKS